jgi:hypothetical protein
MDWLVPRPESVFPMGYGLALFLVVYSVVVWQQKKPLGRWFWQKQPVVPALTGLGVFGVTFCLWWAQQQGGDTRPNFGEVVFAGVIAVAANSPSWAYWRENKQYQVRRLPYFASFIAASIGQALFFRAYGLYVDTAWVKEFVFELLFVPTLTGVCICTTSWLVLGGIIRLKWVEPIQPARQPGD